jgi:6-pyruvoyltetrahydropterin/6-carboxytetrahydropterin synthase
MANYLSTKTYGNDRGLSCCFRQWRSQHSHCKLLHGYSLGIKLIFESETLDDRNWVMDFGGLKAFKEWTEYMFDHTLVMALDDPEFQTLMLLDGSVADVRVVDAVGCEKFAELCFKTMQSILEAFQQGQSWNLLAQDGTVKNTFTARYPTGKGVKLRSVEVFEHAANSATYEG